jgi:hypothetical protein
MSTEPLTAALDALTTPLLWAAADGRIEAVNAGCAHWLGVSGKRLPGLPLAALEVEGEALAGLLAGTPAREFARLRRVPLAYPGSAAPTWRCRDAATAAGCWRCTRSTNSPARIRRWPCPRRCRRR